VNSKSVWVEDYQKEIEHAEQARASGNEGMARVCARRAAGIVIGEYLTRHGYSAATHSAYERVKLFCSLPDVQQGDKDMAGHFLLRVSKDGGFAEGIDLINDVKILEKALLAHIN
jgi:hypothetical protein